MNYDYTADLNKLKEAQKNAAVADLEKTRNQALSDLNAESQKNAASYNSQRSTANAQNKLSAKNFQEYLASTGRANSGLAAQASMQNANNLNTSLNTLNAGEAAANADINRRTTDAHNAYNSGLASANSEIEANYITNLLNERQKAFERQQAELNRQLQERQFNESVRQFNENLALQREQMNRSFRSGSGGGRSSSKSSGSGNEFDDNKTDSSAIANAIANAAKTTAQGIKALTRTYKKTNQKVKVDNGNSTSLAIVYKGSDGKNYYKSGNSYKLLK